MGVSNGQPPLQVAREAKCRTWIFIYTWDSSEGDNDCVREAGPTLGNGMITLGFNQQNDTKWMLRRMWGEDVPPPHISAWEFLGLAGWLGLFLFQEPKAWVVAWASTLPHMQAFNFEKHKTTQRSTKNNMMNPHVFTTQKWQLLFFFLPCCLAITCKTLLQPESHPLPALRILRKSLSWI